jgi:exodeoxyribonuclease III
MTKLYSWNVNGIRAAAKGGFLKWLSEENPDIVCLQETRALREDLDDLLISPFGFNSYWHSAQKKGYSGVGVYSKDKPLRITDGIGDKVFDEEGRTQILEYKDFVLLNCYFPNSRRDHSRLGYKLDFCDALLKLTDKFVREKKNVVICGDFNIAHKEIDLANPKTNVDNAGFLPQERDWMEKFVKAGYLDTFREFNKEAGHYTWWSNRPGVRERNIGWRLDYFAINSKFRTKLKSAEIHSDVFGSDHCPVSIELDL